MPIHENGFLSKDMLGWIQKHRTENKDYFLLCVELNRLFHKMLYDPPVGINNHDRQQLLVASLSLRALSTFQAVVILSERGMTAEVRVLLRSLLEVLFRSCAIAKDDNVAEIYILQDRLHRKSFAEKFKKLSHEIKGPVVDDAELDERLNALDQQIKENGIKKYSVEWFAQRAGLSDFYNSAYALLSQTVHANVGDLDEFLETNAEKAKKGTLVQIQPKHTSSIK